jgi:two-component system cell cycle response regulator
MRIADQRLYAHKANLYRSRGDSYEVLKRALDEREPGFRQHLHDVAELATRLGEGVGLSGDELTELRLAAELHDVGKLAIPDAILRKPSALSPAEWEFIRRHTTIGQRILAGAPALHQIGDIVRSTHERWGGSGYPDGLRGEKIPRAARIIAICDAYSAMVTDRPYRAALTSRDALSELRRCAGSQFDPTLVERFCQIVEAIDGARAPTSSDL